MPRFEATAIATVADFIAAYSRVCIERRCDGTHAFFTRRQRRVSHSFSSKRTRPGSPSGSRSRISAGCERHQLQSWFLMTSGSRLQIWSVPWPPPPPLPFVLIGLAASFTPY